MGFAPIEVETTLNWLSTTIQGMVDRPDQVDVTASAAGPGDGLTLTYNVRCAPSDIGKIIGKQGHTARALRALLLARGGRDGVRYALNVEQHATAAA